MITGDWEIQGDELFLRSNGELIPLKAIDIYNYVFNEKKHLSNVLPISDPRNVNLGISFSKFPVSLLLELSIQNSFEVILKIKTKTQDTSVLVENVSSRRSDHIIIDRVWYPFQLGTLEDLQLYLKSIGIQNPGIITLKQYIQIKQVNEFELDDLTPERADTIQISKSIEPIQIHPIFTGKLYQYQTEGFNWLSYIDSQNIGCILADEMGLGKTIQLIALLANHKEIDNPSLVVAPATILENWRREILKFTSDLKVYVHQGSRRTGFINELKQFDVVLVSYETMVRDRYMLKMLTWNLLILDEAQAIKNPDAKRTTSIKLIPRRNAIAVTGTPVQNNLLDLWSICDFCLPHVLGSKNSFKKQFSTDLASARKLEPLISPLMLRRLVSEVARDLPEKIEIPQPLIMGSGSIAKYEELRQSILEKYRVNSNFVILQKLRMFCSHPLLIDDDGSNPADNSIKYNRLLEILEEIFSNNQKALIFTSWTKMIDILTNDIPDRFGVYSAKIDGRVVISERQNIIDNFNSMQEPGFLVLNPIAGGVGLNITGANHVIHYNLEWNPAVVDQATARAFRRGQKKNVTVHKLFYVETVEEVMNERLEFKREIADNAVRGVKGKEEDYTYILKALNVTPRKDN